MLGLVLFCFLLLLVLLFCFYCVNRAYILMEPQHSDILVKLAAEVPDLYPIIPFVTHKETRQSFIIQQYQRDRPIHALVQHLFESSYHVSVSELDQMTSSLDRRILSPESM